MLKPELKELRDTIVSLISQQPNISLRTIENECKKRLTKLGFGINQLELNAKFITAIAENHNLKWSGK